MRRVATILLIHNPAAGRGRSGRVVAAVRSLERRGFAVTLRATERPGHAGELAGAAAGTDILVVAGGDGTVNEVLEGLDDTAPPLAVLPVGTANVLATELGLDDDAGRFAAAVAAGRTVAAWPGEVNGRNFMLMASVGFDAEVVAAVTPAQKHLLGKAAYVLAALRLWLAGRQIALRVTVDGAAYPAAGVVVSKSRFYGGRFVLAPEAGITVPQMFAVLMTGGRRWDRLRYAWAMLRGRLHLLPDVRVIPAHEVIVASDGPAAVQVDGDIRGTTPVVIRLGERPVRLIRGQSP
jgi:YegS/Rv2252/BmrU family lipid kinase